MNYSSNSDEVYEIDKHVLSKNSINIVDLADTDSNSDESDPKKNKPRNVKRYNKK